MDSQFESHMTVNLMIPKGLVILGGVYRGGVYTKITARLKGYEDGILMNANRVQPIVLTTRCYKGRCWGCGKESAPAVDPGGLCSIFPIDWPWADTYRCVGCKSGPQYDMILTALLPLPSHLEFLCRDC